MGTIGLEPTALFCITPTAKTSYNWIISLAYTQLFETLYHTAETKCKGKRLPVHVRFLLDEFANIGQIPDFPQKLATMRKYEISCDIIIQNMAQLETMYKNDWKTIVGNCDTFIYLGGHESSSTEYVSKMLGKQTIKSRNSSRTYGRQGSSNISYNAQGRELMTPDEIAHMSDDKCLVMVKGLMPFFDNKYDIKKHPNFRFTGDWEDEDGNTPPELVFNIADEIQTPSSNAYGTDGQGTRRDLQKEAKAETIYYARHQMPGRRRNPDLELSRRNFEEAGFNNLFNQDEDGEGRTGIEVVGANYPEGEFDMDSDATAMSEAAFDGFLSE
jgi:type IV secretory pathway TraG/TraD family ATPase VirD4